MGDQRKIFSVASQKRSKIERILALKYGFRVSIYDHYCNRIIFPDI